MTTATVRPTATRLDQALERARSARSRFEAPVSFDDVPLGFRRGSTREVVGTGAAEYEAATRVVRTWAFLPRWIRVHPPTTTQEPGTTLLVIANTFGLRWLLPTRVIESVVDDRGRQQGFVYVALDGHIAQGYERFVVEFDPTTADVTFDVTAVARPIHPLLRIAPPAFRMLQWWFRRSTMRRVRAAVRDEAPGAPGAS